MRPADTPPGPCSHGSGGIFTRLVDSNATMSLFDTIAQSIRDETPFTLITIVRGPNAGRRALMFANGAVVGDLGTPGLIDAVREDAVGMLDTGVGDTNVYEVAGVSYDVFLDPHVPPPKLLIVGANQVGQTLSRLAKELGYRVLVNDARAAFITEQRFPEADELLKGWPQDVLPGIRFDESTFVVLLSHDPRFDEPTLRHVLPTPVRYIGAIGSRKTQAVRRQRLVDEGYSEEVLSKLYGPVGLDLGGQAPEEIALAVLAEITAVRHGARGGMLKDKPGRISQ